MLAQRHVHTHTHRDGCVSRYRPAAPKTAAIDRAPHDRECRPRGLPIHGLDCPDWVALRGSRCSIKSCLDEESSCSCHSGGRAVPPALRPALCLHPSLSGVPRTSLPCRATDKNARKIVKADKGETLRQSVQDMLSSDCPRAAHSPANTNVIKINLCFFLKLFYPSR